MNLKPARVVSLVRGSLQEEEGKERALSVAVDGRMVFFSAILRPLPRSTQERRRLNSCEKSAMGDIMVGLDTGSI